MDNSYLNSFIKNALEEDVGDGDHTSMACIPKSSEGKMQLLVKEEGILAGVNIAEKVFMEVDPGLNITTFFKDGSRIKPGDIVFIIKGRTLSLLQAERLVLNIMQRMSGIATITSKYVKKLEGLKTKILDTRKTTPGMRLLEKEAVKIGGGVNHRIGLFDMILIKDNHIDFAGGIGKAISSVKDYLEKKRKKLKVEIEARSLPDVKEILQAGNVHRIMLDNFTIEQTKEAVNIIGGRYETESSGNITLSNVRDYGNCGVDYISIGALTHKIQSLDLSLKAIEF
jgi:nicotinate-nucleotide pyrophosphorylase (carboxylating)